MANVDIWVLRDSTTKDILGFSVDQFELQGGQEEVQENVPEEDIQIFTQKYRYTIGGVLEINGKEYYGLDLSDDAAQRNPGNGNPQLVVGGADSYNLTLQKKDIQGNTHTDSSDDDTVYVTVQNGDAALNSIDLVNGTVTVEIFGGNARGLSTIHFSAAEIIDAMSVFETIGG